MQKAFEPFRAEHIWQATHLPQGRTQACHPSSKHALGKWFAAVSPAAPALCVFLTPLSRTLVLPLTFTPPLLALPSAVLVSHLALHTSLTVTCDHSARQLPPMIKVDCPVTHQLASIAAHGRADTQSGYLLALIRAVVFFLTKKKNPDKTSGPGWL